MARPGKDGEQIGEGYGLDVGDYGRKLKVESRSPLPVVATALLVLALVVSCDGPGATPVRVTAESRPAMTQTYEKPNATLAASQTQAASEVPATPTPEPVPTRVVLGAGGELSPEQMKKVDFWRAAIEDYKPYWAEANPPAGSLETMNRGVEYVLTNPNNPTDLGVAWGFEGEGNMVWTLPWFAGRPVPLAPDTYNKDGSMLTGSDPLKFSLDGITKDGIPYVSGWEGRWVHYYKEGEKRGQVFEIMDDNGNFERRVSLEDIVKPNCPQPEVYRGMYMGVEIPVEIITDESYGNVVVGLDSPASADKAAEAFAVWIYYLSEQNQKTGMTLEQFIAGWANGSITEVVIAVNDPNNPKYKAENRTVNLAGLGVQVILINGTNYRWKGKTTYTRREAQQAGVYYENGKLKLVAPEEYNHMIGAESDLDPYGPQSDVSVAFHVQIPGKDLAGHLQPFRHSIDVARAGEDCNK